MSKARDLADSYTDSEINNKPSGFKNLIINGGFDVWQRGTSFTSFSNGFTADRFQIALANNLVNISKGFSATLPNGGTHNIARIEVSDGKVVIRQSIEGNLLCNKASTFTAYIRKASGTGDLSVVGAYLAPRGGNGAYTNLTNRGGHTSIGTQWEKLDFTIGNLVESEPQNVYQVDNDFAVTVANGSVVVDIALVQLELGSVATPFEQRPYGLELSLCQRYYQYYPSISTICVEGEADGRQYAAAFSLPVVMRTAPTSVGNVTVIGDKNWSGTFNLITNPTYITPHKSSGSYTGGYDNIGVFDVRLDAEL